MNHQRGGWAVLGAKLRRKIEECSIGSNDGDRGHGTGRVSEVVCRGLEAAVLAAQPGHHCPALGKGLFFSHMKARVGLLADDGLGLPSSQECVAAGDIEGERVDPNCIERAACIGNAPAAVPQNAAGEVDRGFGTEVEQSVLRLVNGTLVKAALGL